MTENSNSDFNPHTDDLTTSAPIPDAQEVAESMAPIDEKPPSLLKNSNFRRLFFGSLTSEVGSSFAFIAIIFLAIHITSDLSTAMTAQAVALVTVAQLIPTLLLGPFAGALVDRYDRKKIMIFGDLIGAATAFSFLFVTEIYHIYGLAMISATARLFFYPARGASIPKITTPDRLVSANGMIQMLSQMSQLIGPALAGFLIGMYGLQLAFVIDGISYILSALMIVGIGADLKPKTDGSKLSIKRTLNDMKTGFVILKDDRVIRFLLMTFMAAILAISMINPLFAIYLTAEFGLAEQDFGFIISFSALTGLISAIILTSRGNIHKKLSFILILGLIPTGLAIGILGLAPNLPSSIIWLYVGMAIVGTVNVALSVPLSSLIQTILRNEDLGKVNGIMSTILSFGQVGGALVASFLVLFVRISDLFVYLGVFIFTVATISYILMRLKGIEDEAIEREAAVMEAHKQAKAEATQKMLQDEASPEIEAIAHIAD